MRSRTRRSGASLRVFAYVGKRGKMHGRGWIGSVMNKFKSQICMIACECPLLFARAEEGESMVVDENLES